VWIDRFASARYFDGFHDRPPDPLPAHAPVVAPRLWLVTALVKCLLERWTL